MRTFILALVLAVAFQAGGRRFWRWWAAYEPLPDELVRRST